MAFQEWSGNVVRAGNTSRFADERRAENSVEVLGLIQFRSGSNIMDYITVWPA